MENHDRQLNSNIVTETCTDKLDFTINSTMFLTNNIDDKLLSIKQEFISHLDEAIEKLNKDNRWLYLFINLNHEPSNIAELLILNFEQAKKLINKHSAPTFIDHIPFNLINNDKRFELACLFVAFDMQYINKLPVDQFNYNELTVLKSLNDPTEAIYHFRADQLKILIDNDFDIFSYGEINFSLFDQNQLNVLAEKNPEQLVIKMAVSKYQYRIKDDVLNSIIPNISSVYTLKQVLALEIYELINNFTVYELMSYCEHLLSDDNDDKSNLKKIILSQMNHLVLEEIIETQLFDFDILFNYIDLSFYNECFYNVKPDLIKTIFLNYKKNIDLGFIYSYRFIYIDALLTDPEIFKYQNDYNLKLCCFLINEGAKIIPYINNKKTKLMALLLKNLGLVNSIVPNNIAEAFKK